VNKASNTKQNTILVLLFILVLDQYLVKSWEEIDSKGEEGVVSYNHTISNNQKHEEEAAG